MLPTASPHHRWYLALWIAGSILALCVVLASTGFYILYSNPAYAATFADNVLRPTLGDQRTIALEGELFGIEDSINKATNKQASPSQYGLAVATVAITTPSPTSIPTISAVPTPTPTLSLNLPAIKPVVDTSTPLPNEGIWSEISGTPLLTTYIRTDPTRAYSVVNLVYIPMSTLGIDAVAGTKYPGGSAGPGKVPDTIQQAGRLVAAFNGGFQEKDGNYGMIADGTTYVPLRLNLPALEIYADGHAELVSDYTGTLPAGVISVRQNGPLLVKNGVVAPLTSQGINLWAGTATGDYVTWRSGLGITASGDLVYAVGASLTPTALAEALQLAGSVSAMQLDINAYWVRFMVYQPSGSSYTWSPLTNALTNDGSAYLTGYEKDFFYLYTK